MPETSRVCPRVQLEHRADLIGRELVLFVAGLVVPVEIAHAEAVLVQGVKGVVVVGDAPVILNDGHLVLIKGGKGFVLGELVGLLKASVQDAGLIVIVLCHAASDLGVCETGEIGGGGVDRPIL